MSIGMWKTSACVTKFGREDFVRLMSLGFARGEIDVQQYHERLRENADSAAQQTLKTRGIIGIMNFSHFSLRNCASLAGSNKLLQNFHYYNILNFLVKICKNLVSSHSKL